DYSPVGRTNAATVTLTGTGGTDGFQGTASSTGGFTNVNDSIGSSATDTLAGLSQTSTWTFSGANAGTYNALSRDFTFSAFNTLTGGTAVDTFKSSGDNIFLGTINGGVGNDKIDYSSVSAAVSLIFTIPTANTGTIGSYAFNAVENFLSGAGNDEFRMNSNNS